MCKKLENKVAIALYTEKGRFPFSAICAEGCPERQNGIAECAVQVAFPVLLEHRFLRQQSTAGSAKGITHRRYPTAGSTNLDAFHHIRSETEFFHGSLSNFFVDFRCHCDHLSVIAQSGRNASCIPAGRLKHTTYSNTKIFAKFSPVYQSSRTTSTGLLSFRST